MLTTRSILDVRGRSVGKRNQNAKIQNTHGFHSVTRNSYRMASASAVLCVARVVPVDLAYTEIQAKQKLMSL